MTQITLSLDETWLERIFVPWKPSSLSIQISLFCCKNFSTFISSISSQVNYCYSCCCCWWYWFSKIRSTAGDVPLPTFLFAVKKFKKDSQGGRTRDENFSVTKLGKFVELIWGLNALGTRWMESLWLSWQSSSFRYQRYAVWIQSILLWTYILLTNLKTIFGKLNDAIVPVQIKASFKTWLLFIFGNQESRTEFIFNSILSLVIQNKFGVKKSFFLLCRSRPSLSLVFVNFNCQKKKSYRSKLEGTLHCSLHFLSFSSLSLSLSLSRSFFLCPYLCVRRY